MADNRELLGAVQAASYNIILQIFFRLQTFLLNGFILRYISKDVLGIINVRLFLYYSTVLFLSKECFRNACLSYTKEHKWHQVINLLWLTVPVAVICASFFGFIWIYILEIPQETYIVQYNRGIVIIGACCVLEMVAEPLYIVARVFLFNKIRVIAESLSMAVRCGCLALTVYHNPDVAIGGFIFGQLLFSIVWVITIYLFFICHFRNKATRSDNDIDKSPALPFKKISEFFPRTLKDCSSFSHEQVGLTWSFFKQGFLKQLLTEGERYVMTMFSVLTFAEQGIFDVISNLGSIAARFIFRPVEDSSFQFFSAMVKRGVPILKQKSEDAKLVADVLQNLLRAMVLLGLIVLTFGYAYSRLLLKLYGGTMLSSGTGVTLLRWHCIYILFLAINGISECYVLSTMSKSDVDRYNYKMVFFSVGFLFLSWLLTKLVRSPGFIIANCANMLARIIYSCNYIHNVYGITTQRPLSGLLPNTIVVFTIIIVGIITSMSEMNFCCDRGSFFMIVHIGIGALCLLLVATVIFLKEDNLMKLGKELFHRKKRG